MRNCLTFLNFNDFSGDPFVRTPAPKRSKIPTTVPIIEFMTCLPFVLLYAWYNFSQQRKLLTSKRFFQQ